MTEAEKKYEKLKEYIRSLGSVAVAFSGGVDSAFLLRVAKDVLGDQVIAVTAASCSFPKRESEEAKRFCKQQSVRQVICETEELEIEGFRQNPKNRCYLCKHALLEKIWQIAKENGMNAVAEGSNMDDMGDYRPGLAAVRELGVCSPLRDAGLTKKEIRELSKMLGLETWNKPSFACLASRFVYGETISEEKLHMVEEAEQLLLDLGFRQVRVRIHDRMARIEIMHQEFSRMIEPGTREKVYDRLKELGFSYIALDLGGYRTGSMNETIGIEKETDVEKAADKIIDRTVDMKGSARYV